VKKEYGGGRKDLEEGEVPEGNWKDWYSKGAPTGGPPPPPMCPPPQRPPPPPGGGWGHDNRY